MYGDPLKVIDDDRNARDTLGFGKKAHDLGRLQMMQEETAGDDIDARIGKWKIQRIARHQTRRSEFWPPVLGIWEVFCAAIQQRDIGGNLQLQQCSPQHLRLSAGDLQNVRPLCARHPGESASEQPGVKPVSTEATIDSPDRAQGHRNFRQRAMLLVQPLFFNKSFHVVIDTRR